MHSGSQGPESFVSFLIAEGHGRFSSTQVTPLKLDIHALYKEELKLPKAQRLAVHPDLHLLSCTIFLLISAQQIAPVDWTSTCMVQWEQVHREALNRDMHGLGLSTEPGAWKFFSVTQLLK